MWNRQIDLADWENDELEEFIAWMGSALFYVCAAQAASGTPVGDMTDEEIRADVTIGWPIDGTELDLDQRGPLEEMAAWTAGIGDICNDRKLSVDECRAALGRKLADNSARPLFGTKADIRVSADLKQLEGAEAEGNGSEASWASVSQVDANAERKARGRDDSAW